MIPSLWSGKKETVSRPPSLNSLIWTATACSGLVGTVVALVLSLPPLPGGKPRSQRPRFQPDLEAARPRDFLAFGVSLWIVPSREPVLYPPYP
jgi:hypothetical protein